MSYQIGDIIHVIQQDRSRLGGTTMGVEILETAVLFDYDPLTSEWCLDTIYVTYWNHPKSPTIKQSVKWLKQADLDRLVNDSILYRGRQAYAVIDDTLQPIDWSVTRAVVDYAGMMVAKKNECNDQLSVNQTWDEMVDGCESLMSGTMQGVIDHNLGLLGIDQEDEEDDEDTCDCAECGEPGDINDMTSTPCGSIHQECLGDHCEDCDICRAEFLDEEEDDENPGHL